MSCFSFYLFIYTFIIISCILFSVIEGNNDTDRLALLEIKSKISDPFGALNSWNNHSLHFCHWDGVTCGRMHQRVTTLDLGSLKLSGSLSPYIGNLTLLKNLNLQNNSFSGTIPPEIGRLHRLHFLAILNNFFSGEIPSNISGCSRLTEFIVDSNKLVGSIPDVLGSLLNLQYLTFDNNHLTGNIPSSLGNLSSLDTFSIADNYVIGSIPKSLGMLKNLTFLSLIGNKLSGIVPSSIFNFSRLTTLDLGNNNLHGSLPSDIGVTLPLLSWFSIGNNSFSGVIPTSISNLSNLELLQLHSNNFRGSVPSLKRLVKLTCLSLYHNFLGSGHNDLGFVTSLGNATMLSNLAIGENNFGGIFPKVICNFTRLWGMDLSNNKISGTIPLCIDNLSKLRFCDFDMNGISGVIPESLGKLQNIETFTFLSNQLSGYIPSSIGNLTKLSRLNLGDNNLVGQIPSSIGNCSYLQEMHLSFNNLNGSIPSEIFGISSFNELNLNDNYLTGTLNAKVGQLQNLQYFDISGNMLSGEIPSSLSDCVELNFLYMNDNVFEGVIPDSMKTLTSLYELNLSHNNLSGKIPKYLARLDLKNLDLSYNDFNGDVPIGGVFGNASRISVVGNGMLCGGIPVLKLSKCPAQDRKGLILAIISGFLSVIMLVVFVLVGAIWYRKRSRKNTNNATTTTNSLSNLSYQSLLNATNGFSSDDLIGSGTSGVVYKGNIDSVDTLVAIKVFKLEHHGASKSFLAECGVLRNIRHRNLVKVITVCSSIDFQGNDFKALVYEYMVNGNLEDWLHSEATRRTIDGIDHAYQSLNFCQRLNIAVDVAFAIEYLHYGYGEPIVHCDLKPSNILLDEDMVAHVSDFGLAKFLSTSQAIKSISLGFRGTIGYAPPEYGIGNEVSTSGDVYSFGILLMEMITGKRPTSDTFTNGLSLHKFVHSALPEQVSAIVDGVLLEDALNKDTENKRILEASSSMLGLALSCSAHVPQERLNMKEVVSELNAIRNTFNKT